MRVLLQNKLGYIYTQKNHPKIKKTIILHLIIQYLYVNTVISLFNRLNIFFY